MNMKWAVVNRSNDIKIATFDSQAEADRYAVARNALAHNRGLDQPWFVTKDD